MSHGQAGFEVRCEWGLQGLRQLGAISDGIVVVDVLSFTTAVDIVTARGGVIFPYPLKGDAAVAYGDSLNAQRASHRGTGYSLSPAVAADLRPDTAWCSRRPTEPRCPLGRIIQRCCPPASETRRPLLERLPVLARPSP